MKRCGRMIEMERIRTRERSGQIPTRRTTITSHPIFLRKEPNFERRPRKLRNLPPQLTTPHHHEQPPSRKFLLKESGDSRREDNRGNWRKACGGDHPAADPRHWTPTPIQESDKRISGTIRPGRQAFSLKKT